MARKYSWLARVPLPCIDQTLQRLRHERVGKPTAVLAITPKQPSRSLPGGVTNGQLTDPTLPPEVD